MTRRRSETKIKLLKAASQVVQIQGAAQLTLDAVAKAANVSKGGLLYHYPNKKALLERMVAWLLENFENAIEQAQQSNAQAAWLEAYVRVSFDPDGAQLRESASLLAAVANAPELLEPLREPNKTWQATTEASGLDPNLATIVRLAADGLWYAELFNLSPLTPQRRAEVLKTLLKLIEDKHK